MNCKETNSHFLSFIKHRKVFNYNFYSSLSTIVPVLYFPPKPSAGCASSQRWTEHGAPKGHTNKQSRVQGQENGTLLKHSSHWSLCSHGYREVHIKHVDRVTVVILFGSWRGGTRGFISHRQDIR